jgi:glutathione S-transferase
MGDVFIWGLFYQKFVCPAVWGEPGDQARIERTLAEDAPAVLDYLEAQLPQTGFLFGEIGLADISVATFFRNAFYAGFRIDAARWPNSAGFVERALAHDCFARFKPFEDAQLSTDPKGRRAALLAAGAPLAEPSIGTREPVRGVMRL